MSSAFCDLRVSKPGRSIRPVQHRIPQPSNAGCHPGNPRSQSDGPAITRMRDSRRSGRKPTAPRAIRVSRNLNKRASSSSSWPYRMYDVSRVCIHGPQVFKVGQSYPALPGTGFRQRTAPNSAGGSASKAQSAQADGERGAVRSRHSGRDSGRRRRPRSPGRRSHRDCLISATNSVHIEVV